VLANCWSSAVGAAIWQQLLSLARSRTSKGTR